MARFRVSAVTRLSDVRVLWVAEGVAPVSLLGHAVRGKVTLIAEGLDLEIQHRL